MSLKPKFINVHIVKRYLSAVLMAKFLKIYLGGCHITSLRWTSIAWSKTTGIIKIIYPVNYFSWQKEPLAKYFLYWKTNEEDRSSKPWTNEKTFMIVVFTHFYKLILLDVIDLKRFIAGYKKNVKSKLYKNELFRMKEIVHAKFNAFILIRRCMYACILSHENYLLSLVESWISTIS